MSNDLVVQLGAKLDQFAADMNQAGDMADAAISRIEQSFSNLNPGWSGFTALGAAATAAVGGVSGLVAALASINSELANITEASKYLSTTTDQIQKFQYAASSVGIGGSDAITNLQNVGKLLNDALVNENSLTKLLDANGIQYKNQAGQLITINQLLSAGADLVRNSSTYADKSVIAGMLGLTKEWVPLLEQGASGFDQIANSAQDAGAIIDSATIQRAAEFDKEWKNSTESFSTYMKSSLVDLLPYFDDLIKKAAELIRNLPSRATIQAAADAQLKQLGDAAGTPDTVVVKVDASALHTAIEEWQNSPVFSVSTWSNFGAALSAAIKTHTPEEAAATIPGYAASQITEPSYPTNEQMNAAFKKQWAAADSAQDAEQDKSDVATKLPKRKDGEEAADAYDRAKESLTKYTATTNAAAEAQGNGAQAFEEFRAQAQLKTAAEQAGIPITQKVLDQIQDLAQDAGDAAEALAKAKVASDIQFGGRAAFLTPQDLAIAQQLKGIYGNDIPAALRSSEAAGLRFNATIKDLASLGQQVNSGFLVDFETQIRNGATAMDALKTAGLNALGKIADKLAQMAADQLWTSAFGGSGGLLGLLGIGKSSGTATGTGLSLTSTGGLYDTGGYTGRGGKYDPAGIVHKGEIVWSQDDIAKAGGVGVVEAMRLGRPGYDVGGLVGAPSVPSVTAAGRGDGMTVSMPISIDARGADAAGLARLQGQIAQLKAELPGRVVAAVKDAKARRVLA